MTKIQSKKGIIHGNNSKSKMTRKESDLSSVSKATISRSERNLKSYRDNMGPICRVTEAEKVSCQENIWVRKVRITQMPGIN